MLTSRFYLFHGIFQWFSGCVSLPPIHLHPCFLVYERYSGGTFLGQFHLCLICSTQIFKFQMLFYQQKVPLQAVSGWFFGDVTLECGQICFKFCLLMQCKVMHQIFDSFYSVSKKWSKLGKKIIFCLIFRGFQLTPSYALLFRPQSSAKLKAL